MADRDVMRHWGEVSLRSLVDVLLEVEKPGNRWRLDCKLVRQDNRLWVLHEPSGYYMCHSKGPVQSHHWASYGDDYCYPAWALLALSQASPPMPIMTAPTR